MGGLNTRVGLYENQPDRAGIPTVGRVMSDPVAPLDGVSERTGGGFGVHPKSETRD